MSLTSLGGRRIIDWGGARRKPGDKNGLYLNAGGGIWAYEYI